MGGHDENTSLEWTDFTFQLRCPRWAVRVEHHGAGRERAMVATETKARKPHMCAHCLIWIERGEVYIAETNGGGGLGDIKFPSRYHRWCHEVVKQNRNSSCVVG